MAKLSFLKQHTFLVSLIAIVVVLVSVGASRIYFSGQSIAPAEKRETRVTLVSVADLEKNRILIAAEGRVESLKQAEIRSQVSAPVTAVNVAVGDGVQEGQILVSLENADFKAQLSQAQAAVKTQEAQLAQLRAGARMEDVQVTETALLTARQVLANLYANVPTTLNDAYAKADDAVRKQTDQLFSNDEETSPTLTFTVSNSQVQIDASTKRAEARAALNTWKQTLATLESKSALDGYDAAITDAKKHLGTIQNFLNKVLEALQYQVALPQATIDAYRASVSLAQTNVNLAVTAVNAAEQGIASQKLAVRQAEDLLRLKKAGATSDQVAAQEAVVEQARASVSNLNAQLAKTVIRAPISGTISTIPVRIGELLSPGELVLSIVNTSGLQVRAYVSESDRSAIEDGAEAQIDGQAVGKLLRISPSIDPITKKIEILALIADPASTGLVVGENVTLGIPARSRTGESGVFLLPIQAVKVTSRGASVYTVADNSLLEEHAVTLGEVAGEFVEVKGGLSPEMRIVTAAQELRAGDKVVVQ